MNGDYCVVINARYLQFRGENAWRDKKYFWHSGFRSGLKIIPAWRQMHKDPTNILRRAVRKMLPKTRHRFELYSARHIAFVEIVVSRCTIRKLDTTLLKMRVFVPPKMT